MKPERIESWNGENAYLNQPYEMHDWMAETFSQGDYEMIRSSRVGLEYYAGEADLETGLGAETKLYMIY